MAKPEYHLAEQPIPAGYRLYEDRLEVAGVQFYKPYAAAFARNDGWLEMQPEPDNPHDPHAIALIGCYKGWFLPHRGRIGHVPKEVAAQLAKTGVVTEVRPRLLKTWVGDSGYVEIMFQVIGPKDRFDAYLKAGERS